MSPNSPTDDGDDTDADEPLVTLPDAARESLKEPMGPIETDAETLLERTAKPLIAVGDVVTYHLLEADHPPDVALVDGYTERTAVDDEIEQRVTANASVTVTNPPATITAALVCTLCEALENTEPTTILVDGEEDLATLPAILAAPDGASVVYGQPGEGMVHVRVDETVRTEIRELLARFEGDHERLVALCSTRSS